MLDFTPADIIFHYFLKLQTALSVKKVFIPNFSFLTDSLKSPRNYPPPPKEPKSAKHDKIFLLKLAKQQSNNVNITISLLPIVFKIIVKVTHNQTMN